MVRLREVLVERLGLGEQDIAIDNLVACGYVGGASVDHVAACAQRFIANRSSCAGLQAVVLVGKTGLLATLAGLVSDEFWAPVGSQMHIPVVHLRRQDVGSVAQVVEQVGEILEVPVQPRQGVRRENLERFVEPLVGILGGFRGISIQDLQGHWKRSERRDDDSEPCTDKERKRDEDEVRTLVADHLAGRLWFAPYSPTGPWSYVVVDIDRHNALQEYGLGGKGFDATVRAVREALPGAIAFRSSDSGGVHLYLPLPPRRWYTDAAWIVRVYLALNGLHWLKETRHERSLRVEAAEVPVHPPRLPFGLGSGILGSTEPLPLQIETFLRFMNEGSYEAFETALADVERKLAPPARRVGDGVAVAQAAGITGGQAENGVARKSKKGGLPRRASRRRIKLKARLMKLAVADIPDPSFEPDDPWWQVAEGDASQQGEDGQTRRYRKLPTAILKVASAGIPAYSSRRYWTEQLLDALVPNFEPTEVRRLMLHWLGHRDHQSADIESDFAQAQKQLVRSIDARYRRSCGVPLHSWKSLLFWVRWAFRIRAITPELVLRNVANGVRPYSGPYSQRDIERTAFFILLGFRKSKRHVRQVPAWEFERFTGMNSAKAVRWLLVDRGLVWLWKAQSAQRAVRSTRYALSPDITHDRPAFGEPVLFVPPERRR